MAVTPAGSLPPSPRLPGPRSAADHHDATADLKDEFDGAREGFARALLQPLHGGCFDGEGFLGQAKCANGVEGRG